MLSNRTRAALYLVAGVAFMLLTFYNAATKEQSATWLLLISTVLAILSAINADRSNIWGVLRGGLYMLAAALFAVMAMYGWINNEQTAVWLSAIQGLMPIFALYNVPQVRIDRTEGLQDLADIDTETPVADPEILP